MAYGFNDDKSKSPLVQMVEVKPTNGETWGSYSARLWAAINAIPMGHIIGIYANFSNNDNGNTMVYLPQKYRENGQLYEFGEISAFNMEPYGSAETGYVSQSFAIASEAGYVPNYVFEQAYIGGTNSKIYRSRGKNETIESDYYDHVNCKIYYIP